MNVSEPQDILTGSPEETSTANTGAVQGSAGEGTDGGFTARLGLVCGFCVPVRLTAFETFVCPMSAACVGIGLLSVARSLAKWRHCRLSRSPASTCSLHATSLSCPLTRVGVHDRTLGVIWYRIKSAFRKKRNTSSFVGVVDLHARPCFGGSSCPMSVTCQ